jgi:hypothetical protein
MAYRVRWQLVGRSGQPLDNGYLGEGLCAYGDAVAAVAEFLRPYPDVCRCPAERYWLARRSREADLAVWVWIERHRIEESTGISSARLVLAPAAAQAAVPVCGQNAELPVEPGFSPWPLIP